jgi:hypothetical protein
VELPNNIFKITKGMRESPSVESPGKLCEMKALNKVLPKKFRSRKIDSVFPNNDAKIFIAQSILAQILKESRSRLT